MATVGVKGLTSSLVWTKCSCEWTSEWVDYFLTAHQHN